VGVPEGNLAYLENAKQDGAEVVGTVAAVSAASVRIGKENGGGNLAS
jgi:hypothetical protein